MKKKFPMRVLACVLGVLSGVIVAGAAPKDSGISASRVTVGVAPGVSGVQNLMSRKSPEENMILKEALKEALPEKATLSDAERIELANMLAERLKEEGRTVSDDAAPVQKDEENVWIGETGIEDDEQAVAASGNWKAIGTYKLTFYCPCHQCSGDYGRSTASGAICTEGRTVAVDPKVIPLGSHLLINGHEYIAEDVGGGVKGHHIDVYLEDHDTCNDRGIEYAEVFIQG